MGAPGAKEALLPARFRAMRDYAATPAPNNGQPKMLVCRYARFWAFFARSAASSSHSCLSAFLYMNFMHPFKSYARRNDLQADGTMVV